MNLVAAVGQAGAIWPEGLQGNQSTYAPELVVTNEAVLSGFTSNKDHDPLYLKGLVSAEATPSYAATWNDADVQSCIHIIKKAYLTTL